MTRLTFLGAAETVTGSRTLVETGKGSLLVDCGLFQGIKRLRLKNWEPFPVDPKSLAAVVLTHAHLDHSGYLPLLCRLGFSGPVFCTRGTKALLEILLPDSGFLQEEEARLANKWKYSKHHPAQPLYTKAEAEECLKSLRPVDFHSDFEPLPGIPARYTRAGHILGAGTLSLQLPEGRLVFSGDVGRPHDPIMQAPEPLPPADFLVVESTYGDRRHPAEDVEEIVARAIRETVERSGVLLVPAFAVGRAQHLLHSVARLREQGRIPALPVFLNSPMSISATEIYCDFPQDHRLNTEQCRLMSEAAHYVRTSEESKALETRSGPMMIIAASGMATGGRILHHFRKYLPDPNTTVLFVGYQSPGTRGAALVGGAEEIKIHGKYVPVKARILQVEGLSAHADYSEMIDWLRSSGASPRRVFVTHGESAAADAFRRRLTETFGWKVSVPREDEGVDLESG